MRNLVKEHDKRLLAEGEYRGYKWEVLDNAMGFRCGYVCIPRGHPYFDKDVDSLPIHCHGGLTFGSMPAFEGSSFTTADGREIKMSSRDARSTVDGDDYWVGFDCGHAFDAPDPALYFLSDVDPNIQQAFRIMEKGVIKTTDYVQKECENIIDQLILAQLGKDVHQETELRRFTFHPPADE